MASITTVDEFIQSKPEEIQGKLQELRELVKEAAPHATETLKWNQPALVDTDGMILVVFSAHKNHINLVVTPSTKEAFSDELADYKTGKGSVQLTYDKSLPAVLIKKIVKYRADEYKNHGVKWKQ